MASSQRKNNENMITKKDILLNFLREHCDECFSSKALISDGRVNASEAAVYRSLVKLTKEGKVKKFISGRGEGVFYQYNNLKNCSDHFHLKCLKCGEIIHLDCAFMKEMEEHITAEHDFSIDNTKTVLYGLCSKCKK